MFSFEVHASGGAYEVRSLESMSEVQWSGALVLLDQAVSDHVPRHVPQISISPSEEAKDYSNLANVFEAFQVNGLRRSGHIIAVGGGVLQDIATFSSALYMRGVNWTLIPTTMNALIDSCLGGKSSINLGNRKNLLGGFFPPRKILISTAFIPSLARRDVDAGLLEGVKIAFARGPETLKKFLDSESSLEPGDNSSTLSMIGDVLSAKKHFIEEDEFDIGSRQLLNFGHTFGHALEAATDFAINHGLAVGIGMLAATQHPLSELDRNTEALEEYIRKILSGHKDEIVALEKAVDWQKFSSAISMDKKNSASHLHLILPVKGGAYPLGKIEIPFSAGAVDTAAKTLRETIEGI